jgi:hypothetical protein
LKTFKFNPYLLPVSRIANRERFNKKIYKNRRWHRAKNSVTNPCELLIHTNMALHDRLVSSEHSKVNSNLTNFNRQINKYFKFLLQPTTGYYDPSNQFAATSLGAAVANRDAGQNSNIASQLAGLVSSASSVTGGGNGNSSAVNTLGSTSGFGSTSGATSTAAVAAAASAAAASSALAVNNAADSTSSPGPATSTGSSIGQTGSSSVSQHHSVQQQAQQQQQQQQQQTAFNLAATNAFAAQQMPPGYAYYFGNMGNMGLQGYPQTPQGHVYQPQAMTVPGAGTTPSQFQKQTYGTRYIFFISLITQ